MLWDELTVDEHVRIFTLLKSIGSRDVESEVQALVQECDLEVKAKAKVKTLSGGQKRKLQLAIIFAGGSRLCCVDEVSTGVDPVSRRKIWDILLAKRQGVCVIMTTHFLDEADWLADEITIMAKGDRRAHGSSAELKHRLGNGYSVHVPSTPRLALPSGIELLEVIASEGIVNYRVATSAQAAMLINILESNSISSYTVTGPTIEELFLKMTTDDAPPLKNESCDVADTNGSTTVPHGTALRVHKGKHLHDGKEVSIWKQSWSLFRKRCTVLRRNWVPYFAALAIALIGSGVTPLIFKRYSRLQCPQLQNNNLYPDQFGLYTQSLADTYPTLVMGPRSKIPDEALQSIVNLYNSSDITYDYGAIQNLTSSLLQVQFVETITEFNNFITRNYSMVSPGGFFLSDPPVMAWIGQNQYNAGPIIVQNLVNILTSSLNISTSYNPFVVAPTPALIDFNVLIFMVIFGLVFSCYPAFFALYTSTERTSRCAIHAILQRCSTRCFVAGILGFRHHDRSLDQRHRNYLALSSY